MNVIALRNIKLMQSGKKGTCKVLVLGSYGSQFIQCRQGQVFLTHVTKWQRGANYVLFFSRTQSQNELCNRLYLC
jgi:hypothetical protein